MVGTIAVSNWLKGVNLYLIGMMGAGKTTIGKLLAEQLEYRFFDTDSVVESVAGQPISQIFAEAGETAFRNLESQVLAELSAYSRLAIATGGGIVLKRENWGYLRHGIVVWLDVPVAQLQARLEGDQSRPLLQGAELSDRLSTLLQERQALYSQADVRVTQQPDETPAQVAARVLAQIRQVIKPQVTDAGKADLN